jgi:N-acetyl-1-D-myo-inositol-2-amino-2-deoxy-alpha-D-glucopyranoside deacetylase
MAAMAIATMRCAACPLAALQTTTWRPSRTYLWCLPRSLLADFAGVPGIGTPDEDITTLVDVSALIDLRWKAIRAHASQHPPYDAMAPELARAFLATDACCVDRRGRAARPGA